MPYHSIDEILRRCRDRACPFWQVVLTTQAKETQLPESAVLDQMDQMAKAMEDSITQYDPTAVTTGKMALAGIQSVIPPDEIIDAMYEIGCQLPACLRETSQAGLATTPTGQKIAEKLGQNQF